MVTYTKKFPHKSWFLTLICIFSIIKCEQYRKPENRPEDNLPQINDNSSSNYEVEFQQMNAYSEQDQKGDDKQKIEIFQFSNEENSQKLNTELVNLNENLDSESFKINSSNIQDDDIIKIKIQIKKDGNYIQFDEGQDLTKQEYQDSNIKIKTSKDVSSRIQFINYEIDNDDKSIYIILTYKTGDGIILNKPKIQIETYNTQNNLIATKKIEFDFV